MDKKEQTKNGGRSYGESFPYGSRRRINGATVLAPSHFRKMGRKLMSDVSDQEIGEFYFGFDLEKETNKVNQEEFKLKNERGILDIEIKQQFIGNEDKKEKEDRIKVIDNLLGVLASDFGQKIKHIEDFKKA